ncbi:MAG: ABC transporter permease subunit [Chloroflexi bacterium]|nr:ABC transporter permease subunit [Chloroflexota bacterium]
MIETREPTRYTERRRRKPTFARLSFYTFLGLIAVAWGYIFMAGDSGFTMLLEGRTWENAWQFLMRLAGADLDEGPAFLQAEQWWATGRLAYNTLAMSVLAIGIAGFGTFLTFIFAARNMSSGSLGGTPSRLGAVVYYLLRIFYAFTRAVPELVWAMLIVFFLSPGILPGAIALGIHNLGIMGRLAAEVVEDMDPAPARAMRASGAGIFQIFLYAILPQTLPHFITYLLYRWEVVIRTTVVVGFVSAGGLGLEMRLNLSFFHYDQVTLLILWYLLLVIGVDFLSAWMRKLARFD